MILIPQIDIFSFLFSMIFNSMYHRIKNFWQVIFLNYRMVICYIFWIYTII